MDRQVCCFTSATFSYLDRVRVLVESVRRHHPGWRFVLCLPDREPPGFSFDLSAEIDEVIRLEQLPIDDLQKWLFKHDIVELCTAVKGQMLKLLLDRGVEKVIYLDPDTALFAPLDEIESLLDRFEIVLTPHQSRPDTEIQAILDNELASLKFGTFNLGFLAVANRPEARHFADWWADRLLRFCYDNPAEGLFTDQRWCDLAPSLFDGVHILRDPGYNVASWNLSQREITIDDCGWILSNGRPLRFFHFTKIRGDGEVMLQRYGAGRIEVFELMKWYLRRLEANAAHGLPANWWAYGTYRNGLPIPKAHRIAYRERPELQARFPDPFEADPGVL